MKAILRVPRGSSYAKYNGRTFEVNGIMYGLFNLQFPAQPDALGHPLIPEFTADFSHKEVLIVDIEQEMQKARELSDWYGGQKTSNFLALQRYCEANKIKAETHFVPAQ